MGFSCAIKRFVRTALPYGYMSNRIALRQLEALGLHDRRSIMSTAALLSAVEGCRFDLWPPHLRNPLNDWALIDVGANRGQFLSAALALVDPLEVVAVEPLPDLALNLEKIIGVRPGRRIVSAALGDRRGIVLLNRTADPSFSSALEPIDSIGNVYGAGSSTIREKIEVPMMTLDDVLKEIGRIGILKIDVQGFEVQVLSGAVATLGRTDAVLIEINYVDHYRDAGGFAAVHARLSEADFQLTGVSAPVAINGRAMWADAMYTRRPVTLNTA